MLRHTLASKPFRLDANETLPQIELAYQTWGTLNADRSNAVLVAHALTGSADVEAWWSGIVGPDKLIDPKQYFVICINTLGSCYGSTGPESINPDTTAKYVATFPEITIRDIARTQLHLLQELGISEIALAIGGSMGGMVILDYSRRKLARSQFTSLWQSLPEASTLLGELRLARPFERLFKLLSLSEKVDCAKDFELLDS
jgi:homoserine O-acetyltransferase